ncbi:hypothetical protein [Xylella fastidiosa]|uniref:hypothetical protein n=1 Tax=Xylella fastidiosa TaxID=2371 RepID=UPI00128EE12E|nr:hypothetical protein [Xylella fastidiosa]
MSVSNGFAGFGWYGVVKVDGWVVVAVALMVPQARCMMSFACVGLGGEDRRGIARDAGIFWCVVRGITGTGGVSDGRLPVLAGVGTAWRCSQAVAVIGARLVGWTLGVYLLPDEPGQWPFVSIKGNRDAHRPHD